MARDDDGLDVISIDTGPLQDRDYIGDGVYVAHDDIQVWLYTQEGNKIALDNDVFDALVRYRQRVFGR